MQGVWMCWGVGSYLICTECDHDSKRRGGFSSSPTPCFYSALQIPVLDKGKSKGSPYWIMKGIPKGQLWNNEFHTYMRSKHFLLTLLKKLKIWNWNVDNMLLIVRLDFPFFFLQILWRKTGQCKSCTQNTQKHIYTCMFISLYICLDVRLNL